ncbi:hypothetical protein Droror1_Dr00021498 [Drosera rotundifolia]
MSPFSKSSSRALRNLFSVKSYGLARARSKSSKFERPSSLTTVAQFTIKTAASQLAALATTLPGKTLAYADDSEGKTLAFGQTTNSNKTTNLFKIEGISGHHTLLDIASAAFSTFSVLSLVWFFYKEKRKTKKTTQGMYICLLETTHPRCSVCVLISWFWNCVLEFRLVF